MQVTSERHEDPELQAMFDAGEDVSPSGETLSFAEADRTLVFTIDDRCPTEAVLLKAIVEGKEQRVKLGEAFSNNVLVFDREDPLIEQALKFLAAERAVEQVAVYDGPSGFYKRVPVAGA
ncbi:hypothetical protein [Aquabacterium humicola]|uniref:hypothetical protein n=1 Tax=Aquabacterium humicola TaxID=3237377 RepID=UPI0025437792|nr:hypothetical protein [Rubrivivax pictus]